jgi:HSP20 family protein
MKIIVRVRELRKNHNLTQEELARQLNISRQSLISLERGRWLPSLPLAIQLAEFFNAPLEEVITMPAQNRGVIEQDQTEENNQRKEAAMPRDLTPWSPFRELRDIHDELDRVFDQTARFPFGHNTVFPTINVKQDDEKIYLEAHLPGYTQDQIDIDVADEFVTISGNAVKEDEVNDEKTNYLRREYQQQTFSRTLGLPFPVISDKAEAKVANGILTITLPKVAEEKPKTKRLKPTGE